MESPPKDATHLKTGVLVGLGSTGEKTGGTGQSR
jgi:hypothetical protein